jgi:hypothetical protein
MEIFDLNKQNGADVKKQYQIKIWNRYAALKTWMIMWIAIGLGKLLGRISKTSAKDSLGDHELKQHKP